MKKHCSQNNHVTNTCFFSKSFFVPGQTKGVNALNAIKLHLKKKH